MEPAFFRGDLLFLTNYREDPIRAGEIVVFKIDGRDIPIVHRVIKLHETYVNTIILTKIRTQVERCSCFARCSDDGS